MLDTYTIVGYCKDNDVCEVLEDDYSLSIEAELDARAFASSLADGKLRGSNGEPFDAIGVIYDYKGEEEGWVWDSREAADEDEDEDEEEGED